MTAAVNGIRGGLKYLRDGEHRVKPRLDETSYFGFSPEASSRPTSRTGTRHWTRPSRGPSSSTTRTTAASPAPNSSCNALFGTLGHIPNENQDLVLTHANRHGTPALSSKHGVCAGPNPGAAAVDAYDWNLCWKVWDALQPCAYRRELCRYALGDTPEHHNLGRWSDGTRSSR
jgi:hypothetical protein